MYELMQDEPNDEGLVAVVQDSVVAGVGRGRKRALRAALMAPHFDPDRACVIAPAAVVDPELGRIKYTQERRRT
jgi:hypothetical protein